MQASATVELACDTDCLVLYRLNKVATPQLSRKQLASLQVYRSVTGYKRRPLACIIYAAFILLTGGVAWLVGHIFPQLMLWTLQTCSLHEAQYVVSEVQSHSWCCVLGCQAILPCPNFHGLCSYIPAARSSVEYTNSGCLHCLQHRYVALTLPHQTQCASCCCPQELHAPYILEPT